MPLGKTSMLFVRAGEFDIGNSTDRDTATELGTVLTTDLQSNLKLLDADIIGDTINLTDWLVICKVDYNNSNSRQKIDVADSCSGSYGAYVAGPPDVGYSFNAYRKVGTAYRRWQALLLDRYRNAELTGDAGHVTILELDGPPKLTISAQPVFAGAISKARGIVSVCKVLSATDNKPMQSAQELSFELAPSGDSIYTIPVRDVIMAT